MAEHTVTVEWDRHGREGFTFHCDAGPESMCRAVWTCECEFWGQAGVMLGRPWHAIDDGDEDLVLGIPVRHIGRFETDECNLRDWFENSDEALHGSVTFPVEASWDGDSCTFEATS